VKAAVCRSFGAPLHVEELQLDSPDTGELRVELAACAIYHSDVAFAEGAWDGALPQRARSCRDRARARGGRDERSSG